MNVSASSSVSGLSGSSDDERSSGTQESGDRKTRARVESSESPPWALEATERAQTADVAHREVPAKGKRKVTELCSDWGNQNESDTSCSRVEAHTRGKHRRESASVMDSSRCGSRQRTDFEPQDRPATDTPSKATTKVNSMHLSVSGIFATEYEALVQEQRHGRAGTEQGQRQPGEQKTMPPVVLEGEGECASTGTKRSGKQAAPAPAAKIITMAASPFNIVAVNPAWEALCGYTWAEVVTGSVSCSILQDPKMRDSPVERANLRSMHESIAHGRPHCTVLRNMTKSGRLFRNFLCLFPLYNGPTQSTTGSATRKPSHYLGIVSEIPSTNTVLQTLNTRQLHLLMEVKAHAKADVCDEVGHERQPSDKAQRRGLEEGTFRGREVGDSSVSPLSPLIEESDF